LAFGLWIFLNGENGLFQFQSKIQSDKIGQFGDFIGGVVGSLWALAGVIMFYIALREQRADFNTNKIALEKQTQALALQIEEFKQQVEEQKLTRKVFELQSETLNKQQFETTFFNLLKSHNDIVVNMNLVDGVLKKTGRECFWHFEMSFRSMYKHLNYNKSPEARDIKEIVHQSFDKMKINIGGLEVFYRNLYHFLKLIDDTDLEYKDKYVNLLRAQLTNSELLFVFYYCVLIKDNHFKALIERFKLFKFLTIESLISPIDNQSWYKVSAYGKINL
jgi:hypothetical protein